MLTDKNALYRGSSLQAIGCGKVVIPAVGILLQYKVNNIMDADREERESLYNNSES